MCDKCGSEFTTNNINTLTFRCPDCFEWISLDSSSYMSLSYEDKSYSASDYDYDYDNYAYQD